MFSIKQDFLPLNKYTRPGTKLDKVRGIVIHWTANLNAGADDVMHRRYFGGTAITAKSYASAHYFVDHNSILQIIPNNEMGYHVGSMKYQANALKRLGSYPNRSTIGIEVCVNRKGKDFLTALDQSAQLSAKLLKDNGLGVDDLYRHYDITFKNCPSYFVNDTYAITFFGKGSTASGEWARFKAQVAKYMGELEKPKAVISKVEMVPAKAPEKAPVKASAEENGKNGDLLEVISTSSLSVREKADFDTKAVETVKKGDVFTIDKKVVSKQGVGMFQLKSGLFVTAVSKYVKVKEVVKPKAVVKPKVVAKPKAVVKPKVEKKQKFIEVTFENPIAIRSVADFDAKVIETVKKGDVFTVSKRVKSKQGAYMYQLKSGLFVTASTKYVKVFEK